MWSKRSSHPVSEVVLHAGRARRIGLERFFVGKRDIKTGTARIVGSVLEGKKDPVYVGTFFYMP
jgi:hypothetical protein